VAAALIVVVTMGLGGARQAPVPGFVSQMVKPIGSAVAPVSAEAVIPPPAPTFTVATATARARSRRDANTATTTSYAIAGFARGSRTLRATNEMRCVGPLWHCGVEPGSASPNARERANIALVI
jgi:hypothetical protein